MAVECSFNLCSQAGKDQAWCGVMAMKNRAWLCCVAAKAVSPWVVRFLQQGLTGIHGRGEQGLAICRGCREQRLVVCHSFREKGLARILDSRKKPENVVCCWAETLGKMAARAQDL